MIGEIEVGEGEQWDICVYILSYMLYVCCMCVLNSLEAMTQY